MSEMWESGFQEADGEPSMCDKNGQPVGNA